MGFSKKEVLVNNVSFVPTPVMVGGCGVLEHKIIFDKPKLESGQKIQFSRIHINIDAINKGFLPPTFANPVVKIKYNGITQKQMTFNTLPSDQTLEFITTNNFLTLDNLLVLEMDFACLNMEYIVYVDLFYELNTEDPPLDEDLNQEEESNQKDDSKIDVTQIAIAATIVGGVLLFSQGFGKGLGGSVGRR